MSDRDPLNINKGDRWTFKDEEGFTLLRLSFPFDGKTDIAAEIINPYIDETVYTHSFTFPPDDQPDPTGEEPAEHEIAMQPGYRISLNEPVVRRLQGPEYEIVDIEYTGGSIKVDLFTPTGDTNDTVRVGISPDETRIENTHWELKKHTASEEPERRADA